MTKWKELGNGTWPNCGNDDWDWDVVAQQMDDDIREKVHYQLAPCSNHAFLAAYLERDPQLGTISQW